MNSESADGYNEAMTANSPLSLNVLGTQVAVINLPAAVSLLEFMKKALVCGAGGFIGGNLVKRLKSEGCWVRGVDIKQPEYSFKRASESRARRSLPSRSKRFP